MSYSHLPCYCYNIFPGSNATESLFFLIFGQDPAEGCLTHLNNSNGYYGPNKWRIILKELHKSWKYHTEHLKEVCQRTEYTHEQIYKNNTKFKIAQTVMLKNYAHRTFEPKYLLDYE